MAKKILVCEGKTEIGICRFLREFWATRHNGEPIENQGVALANGGGGEQSQIALHLAKLGYSVGLFRDSDVALKKEDRSALVKANVRIFEWTDNLSTEERLYADVSADGVQKMFEIAVQKYGTESVGARMKNISKLECPVREKIENWNFSGKSKVEIRQLIAQTAKAKNVGWYKDISTGEKLGEVVVSEIELKPTLPFAVTLRGIEIWD